MFEEYVITNNQKRYLMDFYVKTNNVQKKLDKVNPIQ